jgi:predicted unusual protein kinase regulating ubiquinone biosynthesis (AarF/ABC1/UbiB family)
VLVAFAIIAVVVAVVPVTRRAVVLAAVFARRLIPLTAHDRDPDYTTARALRLAFEDLGPAYVKLGQMIASSPTAFPPSVTDEFARCLDNVRPIPTATVWDILEHELDRPPHDVFATIDETPLASASIAQVHAATLANGDAVVVKVQRPGVRRRIEQDLALMGIVARIGTWASPLLRRANLRGIVADFRRTIREELDFQLEADHVEEFNALLEREGLSHLARAPRVNRALTTKRVLVMERLYGCKIDDKPGVDARVRDVVEMMRATSQVFWSCVLLGGIFHGDCHAGNIMVLDDGRLGYIDFGIFGRFSDDHRAALADWVGALVSGNGEQMARSLRATGALGPRAVWADFVRDCTEVFVPMRAMTVDNKEMLDAFGPKLIEMAQRHDLHLPQAFVLVLKQLTYFGRYVMIHAPHYNENLDPIAQQMFVRLFFKFNAWRAGRGGGAIEIRPAA